MVATFKAPTTKIDDMMRIPLRGEGDTSTFPYQSNFYQTHISSFFANCLWLVDDDNASFRTAIGNGKTWILRLEQSKLP